MNIVDPSPLICYVSNLIQKVLDFYLKLNEMSLIHKKI